MVSSGQGNEISDSVYDYNDVCLSGRRAGVSYTFPHRRQYLWYDFIVPGVVAGGGQDILDC